MDPPRCPFCATLGAPLHEGLTDTLWGVPGEWSLLRCSNPECGLAWISPMPLAEELPGLYTRYYTHATGDEAPSPRGVSHLLLAALKPLYSLMLRLTGIRRDRRRLNDLYLRDEPPGRLLEVGCGDGRRLRRLRKLGWEVEGQEVDPQAGVLKREPDIKVHLGELDMLRLPAESYDAIALNHVIEHVPDPVAMVAECRRLLRRNGILVVVTPNLDSTGHRLFGHDWRGLEPPRHLHLFTPRTLASLARQGGFDACRTWTTAAKAQTFSAGSRRSDETHTDLRPHSELRDMGFQLRAWLGWLGSPESGEECVLFARRMEPHEAPKSVATNERRT